MSRRKTVLILGGTAEGRRLADTLVERYGDDLRVISSLAGRTSQPRQPKGEVRQGGFGGSDGLAAYLSETKVDLLIDATHPFAARISVQAAEAAAAAEVSRLMLIRPAWTANDTGRWTAADDIDHAATLLKNGGGACFITTGINDLSAFQNVTGRKLIVRLIETPGSDLPLEDAEIVIGRPPYRLDEEVALFQMLGVETLVTKNAGGDATRAKIDAAARLGVSVIMIARPPVPDGPFVTSVDAAVSAAAEGLS